ncbi:unnamed protein product [Acanthoscelides obtectus]|uniref:Uncharacterized protein n=1 Tax=Acanthoscelides obtectus TaxID=200917 RepID=A0A9P0MDT2_ACAOB|nr:unnamed protein product [Acanthoscelides obtectus]CAK1630727.1 Sodium- and chloride-dependent glycine transporter 2 [Acanthoscelides obtectus]
MIDWHVNWEWIGSLLSSAALALLGCCLGCRILNRMFAVCLGVSFIQGLLLLCASNVTMGGLSGAERLVKSVQRIGWKRLFKPWILHSVTLEAFRDFNVGIGIGLGLFSTISATRPFKSGLHGSSIRLNLIHLEDMVLQSVLTANLYGILCHFGNLNMEQVIGSGISEKRPPTLHSLSVTDLPNDVFTVLPHALAFLPGSNFFWIFIYYSSIFLRGLCCMALLIQAVMQEMHEWKPNVLRCSHFFSTMIITLAATLVSCAVISTGGMPFIAFLHECIRQLILPCLISFEVIGLLYFYGIFNIAKDVHFMMGLKISKYCIILLTLSSLVVVLLSGISIYRFYQEGGDKIFNGYHKYLLSVVLSWIPLMAAVRIIRKKSWKDVLRPNKDWGPPTNYLRLSRSKFKNKDDFNIEEYIYEKHLKQNKMNKYD